MFKSRNHFATEKRPLEWCIQSYPTTKTHAKKLITRINRKFELKHDSKFFEIGAAQGLILSAITEMGYQCVGIEPCDEAIKISEEIKKKFGNNFILKKGYAENIPYQDDSFSVVIALFVLEHVKDIKKVFNEIFRILIPNGCFYFETISSLCPRQNEIKGFPFFSWYPDNLKIKIMNWAVKNKPGLVGFTNTPAINWLTPWKANMLLKQAGFEKIYDRWDLLVDDEFDTSMKHILRLIRSTKATKLLADVLVPDCGYLAIKNSF